MSSIVELGQITNPGAIRPTESQVVSPFLILDKTDPVAIGRKIGEFRPQTVGEASLPFFLYVVSVEVPVGGPVLVGLAFAGKDQFLALGCPTG